MYFRNENSDERDQKQNAGPRRKAPMESPSASGKQQSHHQPKDLRLPQGQRLKGCFHPPPIDKQKSRPSAQLQKGDPKQQTERHPDQTDDQNITKNRIRTCNPQQLNQVRAGQEYEERTCSKNKGKISIVFVCA